MGLLDFEDPNTVGITQLGLGLLNAGGPSRMPISVGQGIAQGGTSALEAMQKARQQQRLNQMSDLQMKMLLQQISGSELSNKVKDYAFKQAMMGDSVPSPQSTPAGISPSSLAAFGMPASMAIPDANPQQQAQGGGFPRNLNDVVLGHMSGMGDLLPILKARMEGFKQEAGNYYVNPRDGTTRYMPDPSKGFTMNNGVAGVIPGAVAAQSALAGGVTGAQEAAKAKLDPFTYTPEGAKSPTLTSRFSAMNTPDRAAIEAFKAAGSPGPDKPFNMISADGGIPVQSKASETYQVEKAKDFAENMKNMNKAGFDADSRIGRVQEIGRLLDGFEGGKLSKIAIEVARLGNSLGIKIDPKLSDKEAATKLSSELALTLRNPNGGAGMPGAMSDSDREFLVQMTPQVAQTANGRRMVVDAYVKIAERDKQVAQFARNYEKKYGQIDNGFFTQLSGWANENPLFGKK